MSSFTEVDETTEQLISILCAGYKGNYKIINDDVEIPEYMNVNLKILFDTLKRNSLISNYYYYVSGSWGLSIYPCLLTYFEDKRKNNEKDSYNVNNFYGNLTGVQVQQGTSNSQQTQNITSQLDFDEVNRIVKNIKKYDDMFDAEFGDKAAELRTKLDDIENLLKKKQDPSKIKTLLLDIKNLAIGISGSIIASGIVSQISFF